MLQLHLYVVQHITKEKIVTIPHEFVKLNTDIVSLESVCRKHSLKEVDEFLIFHTTMFGGIDPIQYFLPGRTDSFILPIMDSTFLEERLYLPHFFIRELALIPHITKHAVAGCMDGADIAR